MTAEIAYLARHGRTALNADGRLRGRLDPPLDEVGMAQAENLGAAFARLRRPPHRVVAGPLLRTRQTAAAIARALGLEVLIDERLIDRDYGPWTGRPAAAVRAEYGAGLADLSDAEPVVLVAHDAVNTHLLAALAPGLGDAGSIRQDTACWNRLEPIADGWRAAVVNGSAETLTPEG